MKKFDFSKGGILKINNQKKEETIQKLQREKKKLLESLEILKKGAVSAIVEKEEMIEKLKKLFDKKIIGETDEEVQSATDDASKL